MKIPASVEFLLYHKGGMMGWQWPLTYDAVSRTELQ
jgi:hypothetical protein